MVPGRSLPADLTVAPQVRGVTGDVDDPRRTRQVEGLPVREGLHLGDRGYPQPAAARWQMRGEK